MLKNAYLLAKIGADTAENEQHSAEILPTDALWRLRRALLEYPRRGEAGLGPGAVRRAAWLRSLGFKQAIQSMQIYNVQSNLNQCKMFFHEIGNHYIKYNHSLYK